MDGPRRRWGHHQLDAARADQLVAASGVGDGDLVIDVGAGYGALTFALLARGARVIAVEVHPERAAVLRARFGSVATIVEADAADLRLPRRPFHVVANPPFAVTTALLRRLLHRGSRLRTAHVVLQEQAARRWASPIAPGARRWQQEFHAELGARVARSAFRPVPQVDGRVLVVRRRGLSPSDRRGATRRAGG